MYKYLTITALISQNNKKFPFSLYRQRTGYSLLLKLRYIPMISCNVWFLSYATTTTSNLKNAITASKIHNYGGYNTSNAKQYGTC